MSNNRKSESNARGALWVIAFVMIVVGVWLHDAASALIVGGVLVLVDLYAPPRGDRS